MITVRLSGGLGNQMFQYAAGHTLAARHQCALRLEAIAPSQGEKVGVLERAFNLPQTIAVKTSPVLDIVTRAKRRLKIAEKGLWRERHFHFDEALGRAQLPVTLDGYFQSWRYFLGQEPTIRGIFSARNPSENLISLSSEIEATPLSVSLHVRRGDYLTSHAQAVHGSLPLAYYERAVALVSSMIGSAFSLFVFSDDQAWAKANLKLHSKTTFVGGFDDRPWEDLLLMSKCGHHIIANSSFSWWGAWLGNKAVGGLTVAPRQWFTESEMRERNTTDLCPPDWILL